MFKLLEMLPIVDSRNIKCKCDQESRLTLTWWNELWHIFIGLFCLLGTYSSLFTAIYCPCLLLSLIHGHLFQKQRLTWQINTDASRIWSPFYYRACFPRGFPPQLQWTVTTSEEPVEWEETKDYAHFSNYLFAWNSIICWECHRELKAQQGTPTVRWPLED